MLMAADQGPAALFLAEPRGRVRVLQHGQRR